jgi:hypothetical protein
MIAVYSAIYEYHILGTNKLARGSFSSIVISLSITPLFTITGHHRAGCCAEVQCNCEFFYSRQTLLPSNRKP